jgi:GntR family transcriptional regulator
MEAMSSVRPGPAPLGSGRPLHLRLVDELRAGLRAGQWRPGERLPTEADLAAGYRVSRTTVRTALKVLESQGLVQPRHGQGTFVAPLADGIRAGLQELQSISTTIREQGHEPGMEFRSATIRSLSAGEADRLGRPAGSRALAIERAILADQKVVAFSYDLLPGDVLPDDFQAGELQGSLFAFLESRSGIRAVQALAEVHAVRSSEIGWGRQRSRDGLYVLLDQVHHDESGRPILYSRTYFAEGRFQFVVLRTR